MSDTPDESELAEGWADTNQLRQAIESPTTASMKRNTLLAMLDHLDNARAELSAYRAEDLRQREWAAALRESDVRCDGCNLRYGERNQYPCGEPEWQQSHTYYEPELDEARTLDEPTIPARFIGTPDGWLPLGHTSEEGVERAN